ncbi:AAA family ATPase [Polaromonas naphthalenivorans]|uniref:DNA replication and repair protein RecF n=1 Tax=Polaromonas naphthalenivorans (strain CJ2) TaxID=365044 RepID=A1VLC8_POLNA|nr:AAA family ATPase [Polaromonas naphthalenivorans]ABM36456.1 DNA replication and repair protein RecF [Polaromonas naphthalenivorans CJ2]
MLDKMHIKNLTVFSDVKLKFGQNLNVIVGENGAGKTHLLKMAYCAMATSWEEGRKPNASPPTKTLLQSRLADKLVNVFRPEALGRLAKRKQGRERCDIQLSYFRPELDIAFSFATNSKSEVSISTLPEKWLDAAAAYLPTRELLTIYPNFVAIYEGHYLEFEETWRDTCLLLGTPLQKGPTETRIRELLKPLEDAMQGSIELDKNGRFYLNNGSGRMEMPLVAEGLRKLGMLSRLIATGALLNKGCLFWDEPEANLNPRLIRQLASTIVELSCGGIQVFIATHSLFLLREIEIVLSARTSQQPDTQFFGLHADADGVSLMQGPTIDDIGDIAALDESLLQSDRYLAMVN